jgi:hypothetical protein
MYGRLEELSMKTSCVPALNGKDIRRIGPRDSLLDEKNPLNARGLEDSFRRGPKLMAQL